jgi:hypothetical protein
MDDLFVLLSKSYANGRYSPPATHRSPRFECADDGHGGRYCLPVGTCTPAENTVIQPVDTRRIH